MSFVITRPVPATGYRLREIIGELPGGGDFLLEPDGNRFRLFYRYPLDGQGGQIRQTTLTWPP